MRWTGVQVLAFYCPSTLDYAICPITSGGDFARRIGFAVPIAGIKTTGVVRCDQPRVLDLGSRNALKVDTLPASLMEEVLAKLSPLFE